MKLPIALIAACLAAAVATAVTYYNRSSTPLIERIDVRNYMRPNDQAAATRSAAFDFVYPSGRTPATLSSEPVPLSGFVRLAASERWTISMPNSIVSRVFFLHASVSGDCLFMWHAGHEQQLIYEDPAVQEIANRMLAIGCDVLLASMPLHGVNAHTLTRHDELAQFETKTFSPLVYFIEPVIRSIDEAISRQVYGRIGMSGLSGGGGQRQWWERWIQGSRHFIRWPDQCPSNLIWTRSWLEA